MRTKYPDKIKIHVGLDLSLLRPGLCISESELDYYCTSYSNPDKNRFSHRINRFDKISRILTHKMKPVLNCPLSTRIVMEDYAAGASGKTNEIAECTGILKWYLIKKIGILPKNLVLCLPQHLKMFACSKGNAPKNLVIKEVFKKWKFDTNDDNEADAFVLWRISRALDGLDNITAYQVDIINRIKKYNEKK